MFKGPNMELIEIIQEKLSDFGLEIIKDPHISLTKTVVLQYHWIQRFVNDVKSKLTPIQRFLFADIFFCFNVFVCEKSLSLYLFFSILGLQ